MTFSATTEGALKFLPDVPYIAWLAFCFAAFARRDLASPLSVFWASVVGAALCWQLYGRLSTPPVGGPLLQLKIPARPWRRQTWCAVVALSLFVGVQVIELLGGNRRGAFGVLLGLNSAVGLLFLSVKSASK